MDIRVAAEQARAALQLGLEHTQWAASRAHFEGGRKQYGDEAEIIKAALASLKAALAAQPEQQQGQGLVHPAMSTAGRTSVQGGVNAPGAEGSE